MNLVRRTPQSLPIQVVASLVVGDSIPEGLLDGLVLVSQVAEYSADDCISQLL
jgi:hypothetical protein